MSRLHDFIRTYRFHIELVLEDPQPASPTVRTALLERQVKRVVRAISPELLATDPVQHLLWIPGIGRINAFTIVLEIDDITRFPSVKHFLSYARLVPGSRNSGGKTKHKRSKDGNRYLKIAFSHAAVRAIQYFPEIKAFYQKQCRRKPKPIARAAGALTPNSCSFPEPLRFDWDRRRCADGMYLGLLTRDAVSYLRH